MKMGLREKYNNMEKGKKIFVSIAFVFGIIAIVGFILAAVGIAYSFPTLSFVGFMLLLPFLIILSLVWISYVRV